ncbi:MAG: cupin domain-containing protein [Gammaproteobacteria bacterium]|nr:cupin domain-containing protein [Gammaproteobacteria bacterium]
MKRPPRLDLPASIDAETFMRDYWQQRPLLMRAALPPETFPLPAEELAGLACEAEVESRLLITHSASRWSVRHGPFDDADFAALPERDWTLLVQDVDKFLPQVARIIEAFDFVPSWRIDDIMISYAVDGGGVGPHTDAYDVFLMQAQGRRRWRLSYRDYTDADLLPGIEQRILARFETDEDWLLEPGDVLYLPPGVAHWGTAEGECMTYSLGFRAPSQRELAADWFQHLVSLCDDRRLQDPHCQLPLQPSHLTARACTAAAETLTGLPGPGSSEFNHWFGCHVTEPKPQFQILPAEPEWQPEDLAAWLDGTDDLVRHPAARMAWREDGDGVWLYVQGEARRLPQSLRDVARTLADARRLTVEQLRQLLAGHEHSADLLLDLLNEGIFEVEDDD